MESLAAALVNDGQTTIANALLAHYREIGVTNDELLVYLQFKRLIDQGNQFPDAAVIAKSLGESTNAVFQRLHEMLAKKLLTIESITADDQKIHDRYNFDGLYDKLAVALKNSQLALKLRNKPRVKTVGKRFFGQFRRNLAVTYHRSKWKVLVSGSTKTIMNRKLSNWHCGKQFCVKSIT
ncbi:hypothetical protein Q7375_07220 [Lactiplantibacillus plantarum]|nr:hypothetical protein [Lactiplantibacillus plantarum]MDO7795295.1 hypothetical protein [Lactiplantibacillus plantarum]